jgi:acyl carrier protein
MPGGRAGRPRILRGYRKGIATGDSLFKDDHEADSMGAIEILSSLERELGVDIDQDELARMVNLNSNGRPPRSRRRSPRSRDARTARAAGDRGALGPPHR